MTFRDLQGRLLDVLNQKVRGGEISQRRLARLTGFTQPHVHNVLKGARQLNPELADAALRCLDLSVLDLLDWPASLRHQRVPLWRGFVGPGRPFPDRSDHPARLLLPASFLSSFLQPVLLRLADDEDAMSPLIDPGDLVLLDRSEEHRQHPVFGSIYALALPGQSAVCRCQRVGSALVLVAENGRRSSPIPDHVPLAKRDVLDIVRGRVVWVSRELPPGDSR